MKYFFLLLVAISHFLGVYTGMINGADEHLSFMIMGCAMVALNSGKD